MGVSVLFYVVCNVRGFMLANNSNHLVFGYSIQDPFYDLWKLFINPKKKIEMKRIIKYKKEYLSIIM